jgi:ankyrin repeat protein
VDLWFAPATVDAEPAANPHFVAEDVKAMRNDNVTVLIHEINDNLSAIAELFISDSRTNVNQCIDDMVTPLMMAMRRPNTSIFQILMRISDFDLNVRESSNGTYLHFAARNRTPEHFEALLSKTVIDVNAVDVNG